MHNVRPGIDQELFEIPVAALDGKPVGELLRHQQLAVADPNNVATRDPRHLSGMAVGDLATTDDADFKHETIFDGSLQKTAPVQLK